MRILVLDGNENQAVACVRSLGRAGHDVTVGAPTRWSKAGWSRFGKGTFVYTSYAWFRQLPAGVPGAYKMFVNLVSAR